MAAGGSVSLKEAFVKAEKDANSVLVPLSKTPMVNDYFTFALVGQAQNPIHATWSKYAKRKDPTKMPVKSKGLGDWFQLGGFVLEVKGSFKRYHDNFLPIHKKMEELSNGGGTNTEQLRTELNICSLQKVKVIAEECAIMYKGPHMLYWNESMNKVMNRQVRDIFFWRLYHDAHEFLKTGCTPVTAAEETTDTEMTDALVVATKKLDLLF
jgi:hypothetical protein